MPYQTVTSPCYSCRSESCKDCIHRVYASGRTFSDAEIENLWRENFNIAWDEDEDGDLVLGQPWRGFPVGGFTNDDWFYWIDDRHSKGVGWVYENISPYDFEIGGING